MASSFSSPPTLARPSARGLLTYYDLLGVCQDASLRDIEKAYKKKALVHHPDRNAAQRKEQATDHFQQLSEAYEVLRDPVKRKKYDQRIFNSMALDLDLGNDLRKMRTSGYRHGDQVPEHPMKPRARTDSFVSHQSPPFGGFSPPGQTPVDHLSEGYKQYTHARGSFSRSGGVNAPSCFPPRPSDLPSSTSRDPPKQPSSRASQPLRSASRERSAAAGQAYSTSQKSFLLNQLWTRQMTRAVDEMLVKKARPVGQSARAWTQPQPTAVPRAATPVFSPTSAMRSYSLNDRYMPRPLSGNGRGPRWAERSNGFSTGSSSEFSQPGFPSSSTSSASSGRSTSPKTFVQSPSSQTVNRPGRQPTVDNEPMYSPPQYNPFSRSHASRPVSTMLQPQPSTKHKDGLPPGFEDPPKYSDPHRRRHRSQSVSLSPHYYEAPGDVTGAPAPRNVRTDPHEFKAFEGEYLVKIERSQDGTSKLHRQVRSRVVKLDGSVVESYKRSDNWTFC